MDYYESPGFRFFPTEEELVSFYLRLKLEGWRQEVLDCVIPVVNIYTYSPWELPQQAGERCKKEPQQEEWFFFIPRQEKEARGGRPNRLTNTGYWKATGSPGWVYSGDGQTIGFKRTMVFYNGRARNRRSGSGSKTKWKMTEYMAIDPADQPPSSLATAASTLKGECTVCRVYNKTKCLRAFDRRPAGTARPRPIIPPSSSRDHHDDQTVDQHQKMPMIINQAMSSSGEGSSPSSDDHGSDTNVDLYLDGFHQDNSMGINIHHDPIWEFDSLIWTF